MIILTDVDGVLLNWRIAFISWMKQRGYNINHTNDYDLSNCFGYAHDPDHIYDLIKQFNESANIGFLEPFRDSVYYVKKLYYSHDCIFHAISSMGVNPYAHTLRRQNLINIFGNVFSDVTILDCGADKSKVLEQYKGTNCFWLEDHIKNANDGCKFDIKSYLFNHTYNTIFENPADEKFIRINSWKDFYNKNFDDTD